MPRFNVEDRNLLGTMASMISSALENALIFQRMEVLVQRNEEMVGALATLYEISTVLMTTMDFEATVLIIMDAVIHPAGHGPRPGAVVPGGRGPAGCSGPSPA